MLRTGRICCLALAAVGVVPAECESHGSVGKRFLPTTVTIEDPFVSDEFSLVLRNSRKGGGGEEARTREGAVEFSKRVTDRLAISIGEEFRSITFEADGSGSGFGDLELGVKYQLYASEEHEAVVSAGVASTIGGTGAARVGARPYSVITPTLFFGKGFGDLPEMLRYFKPLAVTGVVGPNFPTRRSSTISDADSGEEVRTRNPISLSWGLALQYSFSYLSGCCAGAGLGAPFDRMTLLVELPMETGLDGRTRGKTTGMVAPGVVWVGERFEVGLAAQIPINAESGRGVGVVALVHFFLDELFPETLGRPLAR